MLASGLAGTSGSMNVSMEDLLASAPYVRDLAARHAGWLAPALATGADVSFAAILANVAETGSTAAEEAGLSVALRIAKGRAALTAAIAETSGAWTTEELQRRRCLTLPMRRWRQASIS